MQKILWIGPRHTAREFKDALAIPEVEILEFSNVEAALSTTAGLPVAAAIVTADWGDATPTIKKLARVRPEVQIMAATKLGVPMHLALVLQAGASNVVDLKVKDSRDMAVQVRRALDHHDRTLQERELLLRLRTLNEKFLKNMVSLEKRNIELEQQMEPEGRHVRELEDGPFRVLVIDDEEAICSLLEMILKEEGYEVVTCGNGESGVETFNSRPFNLVITDKNLPGISGLDVLRAVKRTQPATEVIMITGYASKDSAVEALNLGVAVYLEKPFNDIDDVVAQIEEVATRSQDRSKKRQYLHVIKERNKGFLEEYRAIRTDLERWLQSHGANALDGDL